MGITSKDIELLDAIITKEQPKTVLEYGAQNLYNQPKLPAPYAHEYYEAKGLKYTCVDISAENNAIVVDLSKPCEIPGAPYDLVTNFGTSEHIGTDGKHDIEAFYNCWRTMYDSCKAGGVMIHENPKTGNWPGHGFNYVDKEFYNKLAEALDDEILLLEEHPAMGNTTDGWNVICILRKHDNVPFEILITLEQFKTLGVKTS